MQVNGTSNTSYGHFIPGMSTILETKFNDEGRHRRPRQWGKDARANNAGDLIAGNWRLHRRLSGWGVAKALETKQLGIGDVAGDLAAGEWKRGRRFSDWSVETTTKSHCLGNEDAAGDVALGIGDGAADTVEGDWRQNWRHSGSRVLIFLWLDTTLET